MRHQSASEARHWAKASQCAVAAYLCDRALAESLEPDIARVEAILPFSRRTKEDRELWRLAKCRAQRVVDGEWPMSRWEDVVRQHVALHTDELDQELRRLTAKARKAGKHPIDIGALVGT